MIQSSGTYEELQGYVEKLLDRVEDYPGPHQRRHRPEAQQARVPHRARPRQGRRPRPRRRGGGPHPRDPAGRTPGHALRGERRAVRRVPSAPRRGAGVASDALDHLRALPEGRDDPALERRDGAGERGAEGPAPLQPDAGRDPLGQPGAGLLARRRHRLPGAGRARGAAGRRADRPHRAKPRVPGVEPEPGPRVRAGARLHLPRAGGAVRELPRSDHHPLHGAAVDDGRARGALLRRRNA